MLLYDSSVFSAEFHGRKTMGVSHPALRFTLETLHRLVAAHYILDCAGRDMVDARHSVGRWRTFVKTNVGQPSRSFIERTKRS